MNKNEKGLLTFSCVAHSMADGWGILFPSLLFLIALDYGEDYFFLGILANIVIASAGTTSILSGFLADRSSPRHMFTAFSLLSALGCIFVFMSWDRTSLGVALFLLGIGVGLYHPVGLSAITRNIRRTSAALGIHGLAGSVGHGMVPVIVVTVGVAFDWKVSFALAAVASLVLLPLIPLVPKEFDRQTVSDSDRRAPLRDVLFSLLQRRMLSIYVVSTLRDFAFFGFLTFLTTVIALRGGLDDTRYLGISATGLFASVVMTTGGVGSFIGGKLGERYNPVRLLLLLTFAPVPVMLLLGSAKGTYLLALAPFAALAFSTGGPVILSLIGRYLPSTMHGKGFAVLVGGGQAIGSTVGILSGWIAQNLGVNWVFPVMAVFPAAALPILFLTLWRGEKTLPAAAVTAGPD